MLHSYSSSNRCIVIEFQANFVYGGFLGDSKPRVTLKFEGDNFQTSSLSARATLINTIRKLFYDSLNIRPKAWQVIVIEPLFWPQSFRDNLYTILLKDFQVQAVSFQPNLSTVAISSGSSAGIIISVDDQSHCEVICFMDHRLLLSSYQSITIGVQSIQAAYSIQSTISLQELIQKLSKKDNDNDDPTAVAAIQRYHQLVTDILLYGDNTSTIAVDSSLNHLPAEMGLLEAILMSIASCPLDVRLVVIQRVFLVGEGVHQLPGLSTLLCQVMDQFIHAATSVSSSSAAAGSAGSTVIMNDARFSEYEKYQSLLQMMLQKLSGSGGDNSSSATATGSFFRTATLLFEPRYMAWMGGALFAAIPANQKKFITKEAAFTKTTQVQQFSTTIVAVTSPITLCWRAPDWLSVQEQDWQFIAPTLR